MLFQQILKYLYPFWLVITCVWPLASVFWMFLLLNHCTLTSSRFSNNGSCFCVWFLFLFGSFYISTHASKGIQRFCFCWYVCFSHDLSGNYFLLKIDYVRSVNAIAFGVNNICFSQRKSFQWKPISPDTNCQFVHFFEFLNSTSCFTSPVDINAYGHINAIFFPCKEVSS